MEGKFPDTTAWVDLETQLNNIQTLVLQTRGPNDADKVKNNIEKKVRQPLKADGINLTDGCDLGDWFRKKLNTAKKNTQEAQSKLNEATVWSKGKYRTNVDKLDKEQRFWADILLIYQGGIHTMQRKKTREGDKEEGSKSAQGTCTDTPPPYRPSSSCSSLTSGPTPPPGGLYPILEVENGTIVVHGLNLPADEGGSLSGCSSTSMSAAAGSFFDVEKRAFQDREVRERREQQQQHMTKTNPFYSTSQQSSHTASLLSEAGEREPLEAPGPNSGLQGSGTDPVGSVSVLLSGTWKPDGVLCPNPGPTPTPCYTSTPAAALEENRHSRPQEDEEDRADAHSYTLEEPAPPNSHTAVQSRIHLARGAAAKPEGFSYAFPLLQQQGSGAPSRYKHFSLGDITALCDKLHPISEG
ncbi:hypothetical protein GOODEAATRI_033890, partial [Goodea atripinnis]